jgi:hypothetical protein
MKSARLRLILAAGAFLTWIGWLIYLAATTTRPIVLSRPQFLQADLDVIAELAEVENHPDPKVRVVEVYWPKDARDKPLGHIPVPELSELDKHQGYSGPGRYILPLQKATADKTVHFHLARIPRSPGYRARSGSANRYRIYPDNSETRSQLEKIRAGEWEQ